MRIRRAICGLYDQPFLLMVEFDDGMKVFFSPLSDEGGDSEMLSRYCLERNGIPVFDYYTHSYINHDGKSVHTNGIDHYEGILSRESVLDYLTYWRFMISYLSRWSSRLLFWKRDLYIHSRHLVCSEDSLCHFALLESGAAPIASTLW